MCVKYLPEPYSRYIIDTLGNVGDTYFREFVQWKLGPNSLYCSVNLYPEGSTRSITHHVHRLLAICFIPNPFDGLYSISELQVNHKDGNKLNNNLSNLEWVTQQQNCQHAYSTGLRNDNKQILLTDPNGNQHICYSQASAARMVNRDPATICEHLRNKGYFEVNGWVGKRI